MDTSYNDYLAGIMSRFDSGDMAAEDGEALKRLVKRQRERIDEQRGIIAALVESAKDVMKWADNFRVADNGIRVTTVSNLLAAIAKAEGKYE